MKVSKECEVAIAERLLGTMFILTFHKDRPDWIETYSKDANGVSIAQKVMDVLYKEAEIDLSPLLPTLKNNPNVWESVLGRPFVRQAVVHGRECYKRLAEVVGKTIAMYLPLGEVKHYVKSLPLMRIAPQELEVYVVSQILFGASEQAKYIAVLGVDLHDSSDLNRLMSTASEMAKSLGERLLAQEDDMYRQKQLEVLRSHLRTGQLPEFDRELCLKLSVGSEERIEHEIGYLDHDLGTWLDNTRRIELADNYCRVVDWVYMDDVFSKTQS